MARQTKNPQAKRYQSRGRPRILGVSGALAPSSVKRYVFQETLAGTPQERIGAHLGLHQTTISHFLLSVVERYEATLPAQRRGQRDYRRAAIMLALASLPAQPPASGGVMASPAVARAVASEAHAA